MTTQLMPYLNPDEEVLFNMECVHELTDLLCTDKIYTNVQRHLRIKPGIESLQWKIDVSMSQNSIRHENPSPERRKEILYRDTLVILTLSLTDGRKYIYRLTLSKFHELRYLIASALKSMIVLEKRKCMRRD